MSKILSGVYAASMSVLKADLSLDIEETLRHAKKNLDDNGVGSAFFGSTGCGQLISISEKMNIDLLLLGALKREKMLKFYLGSIARGLTRKASCSVLLMINPSIERIPCKHIVVNGFDSPQTKDTIEAAFEMGQALQSKKITLVEEVSESRVAVSVDDDRSLRKATLRKEKINREEKMRVVDIVKKIPAQKLEGLNWITQSVLVKEDTR